jgi:hypothetical protein
MKKIAYIIQIITVAVLFSNAAFADDDDRGGNGYGYPRCNRNGWGGYPGQQVNNYYPPPQANYYYQQPPFAYYQPLQQYYPPQSQYNNGGGITITAPIKVWQAAW